MPKKDRKLLDVSFAFEAIEACPLCAGRVMIPNGKIRWLGNDFWYVVCPSCGLKFMNPRPTEESYRAFYRDYFWQQKIRNLGFYEEGQMWQTKRYKWDNAKRWSVREGRAKRKERALELRLPAITETLSAHGALGRGKRILEVGAGFGVVLRELARRHGVAAYAIEPSTEARKSIEESGRVKLIGSYAEELETLKPAKPFDAVIFSHVLENTVRPLDVLRAAKRHLARRGVIYVQTPNLHTFDQMNPYHPYIFSAHTLSFLAKKIGMKARRFGDPTHRMLTMALAR